MARIPEAASSAWEEREGPVVMSTVGSEGIPNTIYVSCVQKIADDRIVVADNKLHKTKANIHAGSRASLLYITKEKKAYQIKGSIDYQTEGPIYEDMKNRWLDKKYPGKGAVVISVDEVYSGAEKLA